LILFRLMDALGYTLPEVEPDFDDHINTWARGAVGAVQTVDIMRGVGNDLFNALGPYTREQSIVTLLRVYDYILEHKEDTT